MRIEIKVTGGTTPYYMVVVNGCIEYGSFSYESVARYFNRLVPDGEEIPLF